MADTISTWSFSALQVYEECPRHSKLARLLKAPTLPRPAPPKGGEHANDRGSRIHDHAEFYVRGKYPGMCPEMGTYNDEFEALKQRFTDQPDTLELENMWCFDEEWNVVEPDSPHIWLRVKLDALAFLSETAAAVIDYKTGKKYGNEVKHGQQGQLYQLAAFLRYPQLEELWVEFWYLDKDEITQTHFTREKGLRLWRTFNTRASKMTTDVDFTPKPNAHSCKFCPYGPKEFSNKWVAKNGLCEDGVA